MIQKICEKCILLRDGNIDKTGNSNEIIDFYLSDDTVKQRNTKDLFPIENLNYGIKLLSIVLEKENNDLLIYFHLSSTVDQKNIGIRCRLKSETDELIATASAALSAQKVDLKSGNNKLKLILCDVKSKLAGGTYFLDLWLSKPKTEPILYLEKIIQYDHEPIDLYNNGVLYEGKKHGYIPIKSYINNNEL